MKRFAFPLDRVMEWRRAQARLEESKLEGLHAELRDIGQKIEILTIERNRAGRSLVATGGATGLELTLLDAFQIAADAELTRLERSKAGCRQRVEAQIWAVAERRREVRLLEKLKERKLESWKVAANREIDRQAEEAYLARWTA